MTAYVYILCSRSRSRNALYTGSARDLRRRVEQHRANAVDAHTARYRIHRLVYFEMHDRLDEALLRERRVKRWHRAWKEDLINSVNPEWRDLSMEIPL
ncbi:MAG: GIY-YIG nuclease family protein [Pseudomonadota bacterium]